MIKVRTIEQFKILDFLQKNFLIENLEIIIVNNNTLKITDKKKDSLIFQYKDGEITYR